ncbi:MAG TPA: hypothetical protein VIN40_09115 [Candidatus Tyrphobacter sp.]
MYRIAALTIACIVLPLAARPQSAREASGVAEFVRRGVAASASGFAAFRRHANAFGPMLRACAVQNEPGGSERRLSCTSADHHASVETLARFLLTVIPPNLPRRLDRFACDSDSVQGYYLTWEHSYAFPLYVGAYVSAHRNRSYYVLTVAVRRVEAAPEATLPPESSLNGCAWAQAKRHRNE